MRAKGSQGRRMGNRQQEEKQIVTSTLFGSEGKSVRGGLLREIEGEHGNENQAGILEGDLRETERVNLSQHEQMRAGGRDEKGGVKRGGTVKAHRE